MCTVVRVASTTAKVADVLFLCDNTWVTPEELTYTDTIDSFGVVLAISTPSPQTPDILIDIATSGRAFVNAYWDPAGLIAGTIIGFAFRDDVLCAVPMSNTAHDIPIAVFHGGATFRGTSAIAPRDRWHARSQRIEVHLVPLRAAVVCTPDPVIAQAAARRAEEIRFDDADFIAAPDTIAEATAAANECIRLQATVAALVTVCRTRPGLSNRSVVQIRNHGLAPVQAQLRIITDLAARTVPQSRAHDRVSSAVATCSAAKLYMEASV